MGELERRHWRLGWWSLALFASFGLALEAANAFKLSAYLDEPVRRQFWTLAHAHGTLLALTQCLFALFVRRLEADVTSVRSSLASMRFASLLLSLALVLLPGGFFLGGLLPMGADPGFGIWLVPVGALALIGGAVMSARGARGG